MPLAAARFLNEVENVGFPDRRFPTIAGAHDDPSADPWRFPAVIEAFLSALGVSFPTSAVKAFVVLLGPTLGLV